MRLLPVAPVALLAAAHMARAQEECANGPIEDYAALRAAAERSDPYFCTFSGADCTALGTRQTEGVPPQICNSDLSQCEAIEGAANMTSDELWPNMLSAAQQAASDMSAVANQPWLENCEAGRPQASCQDMFSADAEDLPAYVAYMVGRAFSSPPCAGELHSNCYDFGCDNPPCASPDNPPATGPTSSFCSYSEEGCRSKLCNLTPAERTAILTAPPPAGSSSAIGVELSVAVLLAVAATNAL